ncbi:hypothetical protein RND71_018568 [Anisodus tanguticus]|uniref:NADH:quinone oxidoreductase/Mrp antiporter transmembrane domain-containing protein n=1 Tax=Anisodus tanguticus TaxID=243964 RepID=A0AAE1S515_9SOLA|nr:hypothetical protein RND71_018568 [Anisodus tanguticus]
MYRNGYSRVSLIRINSYSRGMFLCGANDLITIFVAPECFSLCSYLLSGYTKEDVRSNEATMKYLLMGGASSSIRFMVSLGYMVHPGERLRIGFKLSPPFLINGLDVYEGVRFVREIPTSLCISRDVWIFQNSMDMRREMLSPLGPRQNFYLFK